MASDASEMELMMRKLNSKDTSQHFNFR